MRTSLKFLALAILSLSVNNVSCETRVSLKDCAGQLVEIKP